MLIAWQLDRLGRSLIHLISVIQDLKDHSVGFKFIQGGAINTTTASGKLIFNIFASLAQFGRSLIVERTSAGLRAARARGRVGGRRPVRVIDPRVKTAKLM